MSNFKNPIFIEEFAFRTKMNYLRLELERIKISKTLDKNDERLILDEIEHLQYKMTQSGYVNDGVFEITQLINSLIGLLVFPQQEYFSETLRENNYNYLPILEKYINNKVSDLEEFKFVNNFHMKKNNIIMDKFPVLD